MRKISKNPTTLKAKRTSNQQQKLLMWSAATILFFILGSISLNLISKGWIYQPESRINILSRAPHAPELAPPEDTIKTNDPSPIPRSSDTELNPESTPTQTNSQNTSPEDSSFKPFVATFKITTFDIVRSFSSPMYLNRSKRAYILAENPSVIHVAEPQVTWQQFFDTMPFSITENCLVTGDQETFCEDENTIVRFFLNNTEQPDLLTLEIQPYDSAEVKIQDRSALELEFDELESLPTQAVEVSELE